MIEARPSSRWRGCFLARHMWFQQAAAAVLGTVALAAMTWGRVPPVEVLQSEIVTPKVKPGAFLAIQREVRWLRHDCASLEVDGYLINSFVPPRMHAIGAVALGVPNRGFMRTARTWQVPFEMPWGPTTYQARLTFRCFPFYDLWPVVVDLPPLTFTVVQP